MPGAPPVPSGAGRSGLGARRTAIAWDALPAVAAVAIFSTGIAAHLFDRVGSGPPPLWWLLGLIAISPPALLDRERPERLLRSGLFAWWLAMTVLTVVSYLWSHQSGIVIDEMRRRILGVGSLLFFAALFAEEGACTLALRALALSIPLAVATNIVDAIAPTTFSEVFGRSAGFFGNPNTSAISILFAMLLTIDTVSDRLKYLLVAAAGLGIGLTLSRGLFLAYALVVIVLSWRGRIRPVRVAWTLLVAGAASTLLAWAVLGTDRLQLAVRLVADSGVLDRVTDLSATTGGSDFSANVRAAVAAAGLEVWKAHPFLGGGVGATLDWQLHTSTHNMYIKQAAEYGVPGLLLFVCLPVLPLVLRRRGRRAPGGFDPLPFLLAYYTVALFTHNLFDGWSELVATAMFLVRTTPRVAPAVGHRPDASTGEPLVAHA